MAKIQFYWHSAKKEKEEKKVRKMLCSWNQRVAWVGLLVIVVILVALKYAFFNLIWFVFPHSHHTSNWYHNDGEKINYQINVKQLMYLLR